MSDGAWQLYFTEDGHPYYYNHATGESKWAEADDEFSVDAISGDDESGRSWNSEDEDRFQNYLLTAEGQRALKMEEMQAEKVLAERRQRLASPHRVYALTPRSPKELAEAYSDMDETSDEDSLHAQYIASQRVKVHLRRSTHQRSGSDSSLYKNGSTLLADSPTKSRTTYQYSDPRQQFMVSLDTEAAGHHPHEPDVSHPAHDAHYLSQPFEHPMYYDTGSTKARGRKSSSGKYRHRDKRRTHRKPVSFKHGNPFHDNADGNDLDTDSESGDGSSSDDEDLQEILAIDESISKVYNVFAATSSVLTSCTSHAGKWVYENTAALVSAVYSRAVRELEKLAAAEQPTRPQAVALA